MMIIRWLLVLLFAGNFITMASAPLYAATPKFLITPIGSTRFNITNNNNLTIRYTVLNQTKLARTLTMVPINGITQVTTETNGCSNPFTLAPNQSCILTLSVPPTSQAFNIRGGPEICKTKIGTNTPDPFLCSKPSSENQLIILRRQSSIIRGLTASPSQLDLNINSSGQITITNNSFFITATDITANFGGSALTTHITQDASNCTSLAPQQSCVLTFNTDSQAISLTSFAITSTNVRPIGASIEVLNPAQAQISVQGSPVVLEGTTGSHTLIITNNSLIPADNIGASALPSDVSQTNTCNPSLAAGQSCEMTFNTTASSPISLTTFFISGSNTSIATSAVVVNSATEATLAITSGNPMTLTAAGSNSTIQTMTIQNTSQTLTALEINALLPSPLAGAVEVVSNTCQSVAPGASCQIGFQANATQAPTSNFVIQGMNTQAIEGTITVNPINYAYVGNLTSHNIGRCDLASGSGALSNCTAAADEIYSTDGMVFNSSNSYLYMNSSGTNQPIYACAIAQVTGDLSCTAFPSIGITGNNTQGITINATNTMLYVILANGTIYSCPITTNGSGVGSCTANIQNVGIEMEQVTTNPSGTLLYVVSLGNNGPGSVFTCPINTDGSTGMCHSASSYTNFPNASRGIAISSDNYAYVTGRQAVTGCAIDTTSGDLINCQTYPQQQTPVIIATGNDAVVDSTNTFLYITNDSSEYVTQCAIAQGVVSSCTVAVSHTTAQADGLVQSTSIDLLQ